MKTVEVACPKCKQLSRFSSVELSSTTGKAVCEHCFHVFQLVRKNKSVSVQSVEQNQKSLQSTGELGHQQLKLSEQDKRVDTQVFSKNDDFIQVAKVERELQKVADLKFSEPSLSYRIPKAITKLRDFAEVKQQEPVVFNLIDPISPSSLPAVGSTIYQADDSVSIPVVASVSKNNVTIHTDSLIFTLVVDGHNAVGEANSARSDIQEVSVASYADNYHWTIATISALVVLILQLFYLIMMLI